MGTIELIEAGITGTVALTSLVAKLVSNARQAGELTQEQAAAFEQRMAAAFASAAWQPESTPPQS